MMELFSGVRRARVVVLAPIGCLSRHTGGGSGTVESRKNPPTLLLPKSLRIRDSVLDRWRDSLIKMMCIPVSFAAYLDGDNHC